MQFGQKPDEGLDVEFYEGSKRDPKQSAPVAEGGTGRDVFVPVVCVRIRIPGNRDEVIDTEAWLGDVPEVPTHNLRFPFAYARFLARDNSEGVSGFPIKEWAGVTRSVVDTLAHINIRTVEQLAHVSDSNLQRIPLPNPAELRQRAKDFLSQATSAETLKKELDALRAQVAAMAAGPSPAKVTVLPQAAEANFLGTPAPQSAPLAEAAPSPRKRGRPAKQAANP